MASTSESGHAKNVANFDELISLLKSYGPAYNPSKPLLCLPELQTLLTGAKNSVENVNAALPGYSNAVAAREAAFAPLNKLVTRTLNALRATDTTDQIDANAKTLARKIQGKRASAKKTEEEKKIIAAEGKEVIEISTSQMSYDSRLDNFDKFIKLLASVPLYTPNEADLKVTALTTLYNDLKQKNSDVITAAIPLSNTRISRNQILYGTGKGLVDISLDVKTYIKSVFGATSPQYKQVSKLTFNSVK
jgi:hypothetical protein